MLPMTLRFSTLLCVPAILSACTLLSNAPLAPPTPTERAHELLEVSGVNEGLSHWRGIARDFVENYQEGLSPEQVSALDAAMERNFDAGRLREAIVARLGDRYNERYVDRVEAWYRSDLGKRILAAEAEASSADQEAIDEFTRSLAIKPPIAIRGRMVRRLDAATRSSSDLIEIHEAVTQSLSEAFDARATSSGPIDPTDETDPTDEGSRDDVAEPAPEEELLASDDASPEVAESTAEEDAAREQLNKRMAIASQVRLRILLSQRDLRIVEVHRYVAFAESAPARWFGWRARS